ncbi:MAG: SelB C-terminal domain-containing protein, partial [Pseudomonadales bacterium]
SSRVRSLRANDQPAEQARAGDRVAVNLAGVDASDVQRGMWLQSGNAAGSTHQILELAVLADFPRRVRHWSRVHVYHGSSHRLAQLALLDQPGIAPGDSALAELICEEPLLSVRGDRLIVRDHGLDQTLGGGSLISNTAASGRRRDRRRLASIQSAGATQNAAQAFAQGVEQDWLELPAFAALWGLTDAALRELTKQQQPLVQIDQHATSQAHFEATVARARQLFDTQIDGADGLLPQAFCETSGASGSAAIQEAIVKTLVAQKHIALRSGRYYRPDTAPSLSPAEATLLSKIATQLEADPPPSLGDIGKALGIPADKLRKAVLPLAGKGQLVLFGANRVMLPAQFQSLAELAVTLEQDSGPFTVKAFRDASQLGRNLVIDVLEHMDGGGYTKRADNVRSVVGDLSRIIKR